MGSMSMEDVRNAIAKFPSPLTLFPSWRKWGSITLFSGFATAGGIAMILNAVPLGVLVTAIFGVVTMIGMMILLPGASSLRLDVTGFQTTNLFRRQSYSWRDVSDFAVLSIHGNCFVMFRDAKPRVAISKRNAAITGGRNGGLPDTYGMAADDLVQLMTTWRNSALNATGLNVPRRAGS
jgi:hypothetical protein